MINSQYPQLNDRDWLVDQFVSQGREQTAIAKEVGCSSRAVQRALRRFGIELRGPGRTPTHSQLLDRDWLAAEVAQKPLRQIAEEVGCSYSRLRTVVHSHRIPIPHRATYRRNPAKSAKVKAALREKYPDGRSGQLASNWRGGRVIRNGYVLVYAPDHPRCKHSSQNRVHVQEHILVMEAAIGRYLEPGEIVHHRNHVKDDNRLENLYLTKNGQHVQEHFAEGRRAAEAERLLSEAYAEIERLRFLLDDHGIPYE